eukprot:TRINITY_DN5653_c0_g3_i1.p1 TRINITY_DN5653_c0_g3~~TRINITY_DN5653_c0_g3_i1.p1  ORF type:complete len:123 (-),score=9.21 TRINITY_DN5653_c0_g3_i1:466-834(-)
MPPSEVKSEDPRIDFCCKFLAERESEEPVEAGMPSPMLQMRWAKVIERSHGPDGMPPIVLQIEASHVQQQNSRCLESGFSCSALAHLCRFSCCSGRSSGPHLIDSLPRTAIVLLIDPRLFWR